MAIGDAVVFFIGAATSNYQPSAGVELQLCASIKYGLTDGCSVYDGTDAIEYLGDSVRTAAHAADGVNTGGRAYYNSSIMITNAMYIRKTGTTDIVYIGAVQTNA